MVYFALKGMKLLGLDLKSLKFIIYHTFWKGNRNHEMLIFMPSKCLLQHDFLNKKALYFNISGM